MNNLRVAISQLARANQWGDIHYRFTKSSTAQEGMRGHQLVQKRRGGDYEAEKTVKHALTKNGFDIELHGRVDGVAEQAGVLLVEEIKTTRTEVKDLPPAVIDLHLTQAKLYAWLLTLAEPADTEVIVRLCYFDVDEATESLLPTQVTVAELREFADQLLDRFVAILAARRDWVAQRNNAIDALAFPPGEYRTGQRDMAVSVFREVVAGGELVLQAPTGIGKTIGTLFPAVKALPKTNDSRIFFLSARTQGQGAAAQALAQIRDANGVIRSVTVTAKDKICFNKGTPCDPDLCEYARGYYDRRADAIGDLLASDGDLSRNLIESVARDHACCPFELSLDVAESCDVIICDYNYVFDPNVYLRRFFEEPSEHVLLLDESHNLIDRAREMYSAGIKKQAMLAARKTCTDSQSALRSALASLNRFFLKLKKMIPEGSDSVQVNELPTGFSNAARNFCEVAEHELAKEGGLPDNLLDLYFDVLRFNRTAEFVDDHYVTTIAKAGRDIEVEYFCINPAKRLQAAFAKVGAVVCFSATMAPRSYFEPLLGLKEDSRWFGLPSPFDGNNLGVFVAPFIDTRFQQREASAVQLAALIADVTGKRRGNYLVFFPSYRYMEMVRDLFMALREDPACELAVDTVIVSQTPGMTDEQRDAFLAALTDASSVIAFAVIGGAFSEAIDLVGERLIGCLVVGVGLPQFDERNERIRHHFDDHMDGAGFAYAYQFPGFTKILQTAGRVIRSDTDRGIVCLIDSRYGRRDYTDLFPAHWHPVTCRQPDALAGAVEQFWSETDAAVKAL